jgi:hypothetical protein
VAPGNRVTIMMEIRPHPGIHVYAPGASGYKPVVLKIQPQQNVRVLPAEYPTSEIYFFAPLNERVPVFQKPFQMTEDIVVEGTPQAQAALRGKESLTVTGSFEYQACDEKECFNPVSVPLAWTMSLRPIILERPRLQK